MGIEAVMSVGGLRRTGAERLDSLGVHARTTDSPAETVAEAIAMAIDDDMVVAALDRGEEPLRWRADGPAALEAATEASAAVRSQAVTVVVLPAALEPVPGPVAVLTPAGAVSSYELAVGAAVAAATARRVEHVNGRGTAGSAVHSGVAARTGLRAAVTDWNERPAPRPERALRDLSPRPGVVVMPVPPGAVDGAAVIADHPDADIVLVFDHVHARDGAAIAAQVASIVELSIGVGMDDADIGTRSDAAPAASTNHDLTQRDRPAEEPHTDVLPPFRASDVVHVRLTDTSLELTNRTRQRIRLTVGLGAAADGQVRAVFEAAVEPEQSRAEPLTHPAVAELAAPRAVLRHWSHGDAEVFEGGERRVVTVGLALLDSDDTVVADHVFDAPNGLDFSVTARGLAALAGRSAATPALPEPAPSRSQLAPPPDVWAAFARAVAVAVGVLAGRDR
ncbi:hypothetical protein L5G28_10145 [Gordonia sp. HY285]|uniref:hypothetical protein n=1 Tax=Gordonia liuliyuniae TaxID=2911517 RepID=UPI001F40F71C|nr:hypothetical protein [Gordonia liuliyuniae]MCF8610510.1 hypothetical protein [Gordonia liuliyuniae]